jgi:hypothetical protein
MNSDLGELLARAKSTQQVARSEKLVIPLGDRAASGAASAYNNYNKLNIKKAYQDWMKDAPRTVADLLS